MNKSHELHTILNAKGETLSPLLEDDVKNYLVDIDGTICDDVPNEEPWRMKWVEPYPDAIEIVNKWFDVGVIITFFTSRTDVHKEITEEWLQKHGFKYHFLLLNKPRGGNYHWIDNHLVKATRYEGKFTEMVKEMQEVEVFKS